MAPVGSTWNSSIALMIVRWGGICQLEAPRTSMSPGEACSNEGTGGDDLGGWGGGWWGGKGNSAGVRRTRVEGRRWIEGPPGPAAPRTPAAAPRRHPGPAPARALSLLLLAAVGAAAGRRRRRSRRRRSARCCRRRAGSRGRPCPPRTPRSCRCSPRAPRRRATSGRRVGGRPPGRGRGRRGAAAAPRGRGGAEGGRPAASPGRLRAARAGCRAS
eukprot:COSAG04_NODE_794_length_10264_cov_35.102804_23_plen_215_part_00